MSAAPTNFGQHSFDIKWLSAGAVISDHGLLSQLGYLPRGIV